jgi:hypothetical protein
MNTDQAVLSRLREVRMWLRQQPIDFYAAGIGTLIKRWDKCINVNGDYVKNKNGFQVNISLSIFFIAFCDLFTDFPSYMPMGGKR